MSKKLLAKSQVVPVEIVAVEPKPRRMKKTIPVVPVVEPIAPASTPRRPRAVKAVVERSDHEVIAVEPMVGCSRAKNLRSKSVAERSVTKSQTDAQIKMAHVRSFKRPAVKSLKSEELASV